MVAPKKSEYCYKHYGVYKTTNMLDGKIYIGQHRTNNLEDVYLGSNKHLKSAIKKYGRKNFKREWLHVFDNNEDMCLKEAELVDEDFVAREDTYNLTVGGQGGPHFKGRVHSEETRTKIKLAKALNKRVVSEETRRKIAEANRARKGKIGGWKRPDVAIRVKDPEVRKKISDAVKKYHSSK